MMNRLKIVSIVAVALAGAPCAIAQEGATQPQTVAVIPADQQPSPQQLDRLFEVMRVREQMATMTKAMPQVMQQAMTQQIEELQKDHPALAKLTPAQKDQMSKVVGKFMQQAMSLYNSDDTMADVKAVYQRHLTGNDVENLITFYGSPSGQHMLDMVPAMMQEFLPQAMQKIQAKIKPLIAEMSKEMVDVAQSSGAATQDEPK
ncbi:MAG TPA: DUF2059 domain-containing protein [Terracidiphilus sp.]